MTTAWMKRFLLVGAAASALSGCKMYRLEELRNTVPSGTPFQTELARLYMDFATQEEKNYDWRDSWYFADKGLMLAYGKEMGPEALSDWNIPDEVYADMEKARTRVMALLTPEITAAQPVKAAAMQFYFDCWVEQQEENWQEDDIAFCRDNLLLTMGELSSATPKVASMPEPVKAPAPKEKKAKPVAVAKPEAEAAKEAKAPEAVMSRAVETASYAVFFETGKAEVSRPGLNVIEEVIRTLKGAADYLVVLHTAEAGAAETEDPLSVERSEVVKKLLMDGGISESAIVMDKNAKAAEAGRKINRRVELFLNE
jgi:OmpA-OmpF porin, OOP family